MFQVLEDILTVFFWGIFSQYYFVLNLCALCCLGTGFFSFLYLKQEQTYFLLSLFFILFCATIYFHWRYSNTKQKYENLFYEFYSIPGACAILNENNIILEANDLFRVLGGSKQMKHIDDFLMNFKEYVEFVNIIRKALQIKSDSFFQDIILGDKVWRISSIVQEVRKKQLKFLYIFDITSSLKISHGDNMFSNLLNVVNNGILLVNKYGGIHFYNNAAASMLKISLSGKNINSIPELSTLQINLKQKVRYKNGILEVYVTNFDEYKLYKLELEYNNLDEILNEIPFGVIVLDKDMHIVGFNKFISQYIKKDQITSTEQLIAPEQQGIFTDYLRSCFNNISTKPSKFNLNNIKGPLITVYTRISKNNQYIIFFLEDVTMRELQTQFMHEQRLYTLGEIVGSISHDFNNMITSVLMICDGILSRNSIEHTDPDYIDIMKIKHSTSKAANLIKQILNISRKQTIEETIIDIGDIVNEFIATIGRVVGDNIEISVNKIKSRIYVYINEVNFEQILINLILNARDAMPYGGNIIITIDSINIAKSLLENDIYIAAGDYLELTVEDNGVGILQSNIKKIFEPFFTTKKEKGTGFGLSTVNAIIKQKRGFIRVTSKMNIGTKFKIYLPLYNIKVSTNDKIINNQLLQEDRMILLVEDEKTILHASYNALKNKGFNVLSAENASDALLISQNTEEIFLLITDISLPKMNGIDLYEEMKKKHKNLYVLFISGFSDDDIERYKEKQSQAENNRIFFLQKPYSINDLHQYILKILI